MATVVEYVCRSCGSVYESEVRADAVQCWNPDCGDLARRRWSANIATSNLKEARK